MNNDHDNDNSPALNQQKSIAFIGSVGIPNCYGGFEAFLESVTPVMAEAGHEIYVTCDKARYEDLSDNYRGVNRVFISVGANGIRSPFHDLIAYLKVFYKTDSVVVLGVSAGPFFLIMRLLSFLFRKKLVVNVDGVEWRRSKFSKPVRFVLKIFDMLAQFSANKIVYDNRELESFLFKPFRKKSVCIAYSGDHVIRYPDIKQKSATALTICRIEPENNIEMLITGALLSKLDTYKIIGNWDNSEFGQEIKKKYKGHSKIQILDPVYDPEILGQLREECSVYLHGHSVGGTNPSLVEMLFYDCELLCFDCGFNRATAGNAADYFDSPENLAEKLDLLGSNSKKGKDNSIRSNYTAQVISNEYLSVL